MQRKGLRRSRRMALATVSVSFAIVLAGCAGSPSDSGDSGGSTDVPAKPDVLTLNVYGGAFQENMQKYVADPFEAEYGIKVDLVSSAPPLATLKAQGNNPEIDLFIAGDPQRLLAEQAGLLQEYDPSVVTNAKDLYDVARKSDSAVIINVASQGLVFDTTKVSTVPTSWFDLFDYDLPSQIVVRAPDAQNTVSWLSVMAKSLNGDWPTQLSDYDEVLARVKAELKPNLYAAVSSSGDTRSAMTSGDVAMGVWQDSQVLAANADGSTLAYAQPKEGPIPVATMVALTNTPNKYWAEMLMNQMLDATAQVGWAQNGGYGPTNSTAEIDDALAAQITYGTDEIAALVTIPWEQIIPITTELIESFNAAISN